MAEMQRLQQALKAAHEAGNQEHARAIAQAIRAKQQEIQQPQQRQPDPNMQRQAQIYGQMRGTDATPTLTDEDLAGIEKKMSQFKRAYNYGQEDSTTQKKRERLTKLEQLRKVNPGQAENIEDLSMLDNFMIGAGRGLVRIGQGITGTREDPQTTQAIEQARQLSPTGAALTVGEVVGETAPFVPAGVATAGIRGIAGRTAAGVGIGGTEGALIARGRGGDALQGAGIGAATAGALELGIPVIGRLAGATFRRLTGRAPTVPLITPEGQPTPEFEAVLRDGGYDTRQFYADAQKVAQGGAAGGDGTAETVTEVAGAVSRGGQPRDLQAIAGQPEVDPDILAAADRLGVGEQMPLSAMSQNQQFIELEQGLTSIIGSQASQRQVAAIEAVNQTADDIIQELGGVTDKADLSQRIASRAEVNRNELQNQANTLYNQMSGPNGIPQGLTLRPANWRSGGLSAGNTEVFDLSKIENYVGTQVRNLGGQGELSTLQKRMQRLTDSSRNVTYGLVDKLRKDVGEQIGRQSTPFPTASSRELGEIYSILTDVQGQVADRYGLGDVWSQGKALVAQRKALEEQMVNAFGRDQAKAIIPTLGRGLTRITSGELSDFRNAMAAIPQELRGEAVATALNDVFTRGSRQSQLNMGGFADWYRDLNRSPTAKRELFQHLPGGAQQRVDDLYTVSAGFQRALRNKKDTGRVQTLFNQFDKPDGWVSKLYQVGRAAAGMGEPQSAAMSGVVDMMRQQGRNSTADLAGGLITSPEFRRLVLAEMNNPNAQATRRARRALTQSQPYNEWVESLPRNARAEIASIGLVPWMLDEETDEEAQ